MTKNNMSKIPQNVIWYAQFKDGSIIKEYDDNGKETLFTEILDRRSDIVYFALQDLKNNRSYGIELNSGSFILQGLPINIGKDVGGYIMNFTHLKDIDYSSGLIQYKAAVPIALSVKPVKAKPKAFNIGYDVKLKNFIYPLNDGSSIEVLRVKPILSLDSRTFLPSIAISMSIKKTLSNGYVKTFNM